MKVRKSKILCSVAGCLEEGTVGKQVQKADDPTVYVIPECEEHAAMDGAELEVRDDTIFVPAAPQESCGGSS